MTTISEGATKLVGRFIAETPNTSFSNEDLFAAKLSLIDTAFAFSVSAAQMPESALLGLDRDESAGLELCGVHLSAAPVFASLAFGATARSHELDDWAPYGAASAPLFGALLCLAQIEGISDEVRLLDAWCVGVRVGVALWTKGRYRQADRGFDGTDIFGSIACAAAGARLLKLDADQSSAAVAIACSEMGGLVVNLGTDVGVMHAGFAARNGFQAALLARAGIYGATDALEARQGFGEAIFGPADGPLFGLNQLLESGTALSDVVRLRRYPSAIEHQRAIATVLSLASEASISRTEIATIHVEGVPPTSEGTRFDVPADGEAAQRSLRYVLSCLLRNESITLSDFTTDSVTNRTAGTSLDRVEVDILQRWDARLLQDNPADATRVTLTTNVGRILIGDPADAPSTLDEFGLLSKWQALVSEENMKQSPWARAALATWSSTSDGAHGFAILDAIRSS